ncbi:MAG: class I SAM-dependent methyltransferase [Candidatus Limnocylindria bacterium]
MGEDITDAAYDRYGEDYERWMAPIVGPAAVRLLDRLEDRVPDDRPIRLLDVGTGTGTLVLAALERWPRAVATGVDPSRVMLGLAGTAARARNLADRLSLARGDAVDLPIEDASVELVVSSFVIQLVSSRAAMLREILRVLRPGGVAAVLTWQLDDESFEPDELVGDVIDEMGIVVPDAGPDGTRPYASPASAAAELRRIGFRDVRATREWLDHRYTPRTFLNVVEHWTDDDIFASLSEPVRSELRSRILQRLERRRPEELRWRRPLVSVVGRRP